MSQKKVNRKLTCILSTDVVGYSRLMEENEVSTVQYLEENKKLISKLVKEYNGRVVDSPGDNLLAEFNSAVQAVDCAVEAQKELKIKNVGLTEKRKMHFRIGINLGDVIEEDGRLYGSGVNIAARLEGLAEPGGIYISRNVFDQVKTKLDLGYEYLGEHIVKNISEPVRVYSVLIGDEFAGKIIGEKRTRRRITGKISGPKEFPVRSRIMFYSTTIILFLVVGAVFIYQLKSRQNFSGRLPAKINLAILPFQTIDLTGDSKAFANGLIATMNAQLTKLRSQHPVLVISASEIREKNIHTIQEAIVELGVNLVMEGTLQQIGEKMRITYTMVDAKTKQGLKSDVITDSISNPFNLMDNVVASVLNNLRVDLLPDEKGSIATRTTQQPEAYNYYMTAVGYLQDYQKPENVQNAIRILQKAIEQDPKFAEAYAALGEARWRQYEHEKETTLIKEAYSACNRAQELDSNLVNGYICMGELLTEMGKYDKAVEEFKRALVLEPTSDEAYRGLGEAYEYLGLFDEAEKVYNQAIRLKPEYWAGYSYLGVMYLGQGRYEEAIEQFNQVAQLVPDHNFAYNNIGCVYLVEGKYSEAVQVLKHSVTLRPTEEAYSNLGTAYFFLRNYREAAAAYEKALEINDKDPLIWGNLGDARFSADPENLTSAREAYRKALILGEKRLSLNPRDVQMLVYMAGYSEKLDEKEEAQKYIKRVLAENPKNPQILLKLAGLYCQLEENEQAMDLLKRAMEAGLTEEFLKSHSDLDRLRKSKEFQDMLQDD